MKILYACDFCNCTDEHKSLILEHESECIYNPIFKNCHSCNLRKWSMSKSIISEFKAHYCQNNHDHDKYEYNGNCQNWIPKNIKQYRKEKLKKLTTDEKL